MTSTKRIDTRRPPPHSLDSFQLIRIQKWRPLGRLPLALSSGVGTELRRPLGIAIVGGLLLSQLLTLYTTPVMYLYLDRLRLWLKRKRGRRGTPAETSSPLSA